MIDPATINLTTLPWLPLEEKTAFPKRPAIYFAIDSLGNVQYIGRAKNVKARWGSHHKYNELAAIANIKVAYLFVDLPQLLPQIETALIEYFDPPLNTIKLVQVDNYLMPRKPKPKREEIKVNYRLAPDVKNGVAATAEIAGRSENLQAEYLLKLGLLSVKGVDTTKMNDEEVITHFNKFYGEIND